MLPKTRSGAIAPQRAAARVPRFDYEDMINALTRKTGLKRADVEAQVWILHLLGDCDLGETAEGDRWVSPCVPTDGRAL